MTPGPPQLIGLPYDASSSDGPVYVTIDLDGIDPTYAPRVSHRAPKDHERALTAAAHLQDQLADPVLFPPTGARLVIVHTLAANL